MAKRNSYLLHIGGGHTGKAVLLHTDYRAGSKLFKEDASKILSHYGFDSFASCERVSAENNYSTKRCEPCTVINMA